MSFIERIPQILTTPWIMIFFHYATTMVTRRLEFKCSAYATICVTRAALVGVGVAIAVDSGGVALIVAGGLLFANAKFAYECIGDILGCALESEPSIHPSSDAKTVDSRLLSIEYGFVMISIFAWQI